MSTQLVTRSARFGQIEYQAEDLVHFHGRLVGFPAYDGFLLLQHKEGSPFRWLQSVEEPTLAFLVVDPATFLEDYAPEMPESDCKALELVPDTPRLVYTIVTIPPGRPRDMTLNLAGPLVINAVTGKARQVVLEDSQYPIRFQVFQEEEAMTAVAA